MRRESLARRETKGRLVQRVQLVIQVNKALLEKPDLLVLQEMWVKLVLSVALELQDHLVSNISNDIVQRNRILEAKIEYSFYDAVSYFCIQLVELLSRIG